MPVYRVLAKKVGALDIEADGFKIDGGFVVFYETYEDGSGADVGLAPLKYVRGLVRLSALASTDGESNDPP
jgi:hypothetical protein